MAQQREESKLPRLPLVTNPENRDDTDTMDARLVNCYAEKGDDGKFYVYKRPGYLYNSQPSGGAANGYGCYLWETAGTTYFVSIFGAVCYVNGVSVGAVDATGGVYRFNQCLGGTPKVFMDNGVQAYNYDPVDGLVEVTDVDMITPRVHGSAYLDASMYVMSASATIQASDLNDPTTWPALNTLIAQIEPDGGVGLTKQLVYVIAMKQWTTEVFYDAANPTGSPLGTVQGAKVNWGCVSADSIQDVDGKLLWLAVNRGATPQVMMMDNLQATIVSTKPVERLLKGLNYSTVYSFQYCAEGHKFYVVTIKAANLTLAFDVQDKTWAIWTDVNGNYLPIVCSTFDSSYNHYWQHETNGKLYTADRVNNTTDDGATITVDIYTPNFDANVRFTKSLPAINFIADQKPGSMLSVRHSDDDYQGWSTPRMVDLSEKNPRLTDNGSFYRRAYHLRHQSNTTLRLEAMELQLDLGII